MDTATRTAADVDITTAGAGAVVITTAGAAATIAVTDTTDTRSVIFPGRMRSGHGERNWSPAVDWFLCCWWQMRAYLKPHFDRDADQVGMILGAELLLQQRRRVGDRLVGNLQGVGDLDDLVAAAEQPQDFQLARRSFAKRVGLDRGAGKRHRLGQLRRMNCRRRRPCALPSPAIADRRPWRHSPARPSRRRAPRTPDRHSC